MSSPGSGATWLLALDAGYRGFVLETAATPSFAELELSAQEELELLRPRGRPTIPGQGWPKGKERDGYCFEILVPWEAMPPANRLTLDRLFLDVRVHRAGGSGLSSSSRVDLPGRELGGPPEPTESGGGAGRAGLTRPGR